MAPDILEGSDEAWSTLLMRAPICENSAVPYIPFYCVQQDWCEGTEDMSIIISDIIHLYRALAAILVKSGYGYVPVDRLRESFRSIPLLRHALNGNNPDISICREADIDQIDVFAYGLAQASQTLISNETEQTNMLEGFAQGVTEREKALEIDIVA